MTTETVLPQLETTHRAWLWLLLAVLLGVFASGQWAVPLATWLSGVFMLRFVRSRRPFRGYLLAALATIPMLAISWSIFPFGGTIGLIIFSVVASFIGSLPLLLDRLLAPHRPGFLRTLVFPVAVTALEFLGGINEDFGSWGATAYSQVDHPALLQLAAVLGLPGIAFLLAWFAALANELWEADWSVKARWRGLLVFGAVLATVLATGALRLATRPVVTDTARVAAISTARWGGFGDKEILWRFKGDEPLNAADARAIRGHHAAQNQALLDTTRREAVAGAQLVVWAEAAAVVVDVDEAAYLAQGQALAREQDIVLAMALGVLDSGDSPRRIANKLVLITPDGQLASEYLKAIPTPGGERAWSRRGDGELQVTDTALGRIAGVICYDADFPALIAQAGEQDVDLLLVPAGDWAAIASMHADMARVRAIEQGVNLVRPAAAGLSTAVDAYGVPLASHRWVEGSDAVLVAQVPTAGVSTIYARIGDTFGWLTVLALALSMVTGFGGWLRRRVASSEQGRIPPRGGTRPGEGSADPGHQAGGDGLAALADGKSMPGSTPTGLCRAKPMAARSPSWTSPASPTSAVPVTSVVPK